MEMYVLAGNTQLIGDALKVAGATTIESVTQDF